MKLPEISVASILLIVDRDLCRCFDSLTDNCSTSKQRDANFVMNSQVFRASAHTASHMSDRQKYNKYKLTAV